MGLLLSLSVIASLVSYLLEANSNTLVLVLLLIGLACGTLVAVALTRGITGPVGKLVSASQAIAKGDLSQRVDIQSKDEFGILGEAFNEMIAQRQRAYEELEIRVQERTQELAKVNEVIAVADEVARIITSTLDIDQVYEKFALELKKLVDFDRMNINVIDYEGDFNETKYLFGEALPESQVGRVRPMEGSLSKRVADTQQTLVQPDIGVIPRSAPGG